MNQTIQKKWVFATLLALLCLIAYEPGRIENTTGDTISMRYWPVSILKYKTITLDPFFADMPNVIQLGIRNQDGHLYPRHHWGSIVFSLPLYWVADQTGWLGSTWTHDRISHLSRWNACLIAIAAVISLFFLMNHFVSIGPAAVSATVFAFGTWNWSLGAQGLHSQAICVLLHIWSLHVIWRLTQHPTQHLKQQRSSQKNTDDKTLWLTFGLGVLHALIWTVRIQDFVACLPALLLLRNRRQWAAYLLPLLAITLPLLFAYQFYYDSFMGFYGPLYKQGGAGQETVRANFLLGFFGLVFSPNRGAIVFIPLLLLVPFLWNKFLPPMEFTLILKAFRRFQAPKLTGAALYANISGWSAVLYFAVLCFATEWHATWSYGARYLYNLSPFIWPVITLAIAEFPIWRGIKRKPTLPRWALILIPLFALQGVAVHGLGNRNYDVYVWNSHHHPITDGDAWDWNDWMIAEVWKLPPNTERHKDPLLRLRGGGF